MRSKHAKAGLVVGATVLMGLVPAAMGHPSAIAATAAPKPNYYLALGDSLTVGFQPGATSSWTNGWVYQLRDAMAKSSSVELNNYGHRGECSDTFITGGLAADCPTKTVDSPSQLAEALGFINDHPGQVRLITIEVGGNDLNGNKQLFLNSDATKQKAILGKIFPKMAHNWGTIFGTLRKACPTCEIVALNQYNPFPKGATLTDLSPVFTTYTALLQQASAPAKVRLADVYTPFVGHELQYTWFAHGDIHANTTGYAVMEAAVAKTLAARS
jgi:lysophospholipase L1-like esterase